MPLIYIFLFLLGAGMALWLVNTYVPMARGIKAVLNVVAVVVICVWLLKAFGLWTHVVSYRLSF